MESSYMCTLFFQKEYIQQQQSSIVFMHSGAENVINFFCIDVLYPVYFHYSERGWVSVVSIL